MHTKLLFKVLGFSAEIKETSAPLKPTRRMHICVKLKQFQVF